MRGAINLSPYSFFSDAGRVAAYFGAFLFYLHFSLVLAVSYELAIFLDNRMKYSDFCPCRMLINPAPGRGYPKRRERNKENGSTARVRSIENPV